MSKKTNNQNKGGGGGLIGTLAYWAIVFLALVMVVNAVLTLLQNIFNVHIEAGILNILTKIAFAIAIAITVMLSYGAAKAKGKKMYTVWLVSAILVVLSYILGITIL